MTRTPALPEPAAPPGGLYVFFKRRLIPGGDTICSACHAVPEQSSG